jgi:hypothetical protein
LTERTGAPGGIVAVQHGDDAPIVAVSATTGDDAVEALTRPGASTRIWYDPRTDSILLVYLNRNDLSLDEAMATFLDEVTA